VKFDDGSIALVELSGLNDTMCDSKVAEKCG
jgi:hypothetical protein